MTAGTAAVRIPMMPSNWIPPSGIDCDIIASMSIDLTPDQQQQLDRTDERPARIRDPRTQTDYVLIPTEEYEHIREVLEDDAEQRALRRAAARGLAKRLADEPE